MSGYEQLARACDEMMELASLKVIAHGWRPTDCTWAQSPDGRRTLYVGSGQPAVGETLRGTPVFEVHINCDFLGMKITVEGRWLAEIPPP